MWLLLELAERVGARTAKRASDSPPAGRKLFDEFNDLNLKIKNPMKGSPAVVPNIAAQSPYTDRGESSTSSAVGKTQLSKINRKLQPAMEMENRARTRHTTTTISQTAVCRLHGEIPVLLSRKTLLRARILQWMSHGNVPRCDCGRFPISPSMLS